MFIAKPVRRLIDELQKLPSIGPKTAERLTYFLLRVPREDTEALAQAISELKAKTVVCETCFNYSETNPCEICSDSQRDQGILCVVEEPLDVIALEKTGKFKGLYHVLGGAIAPASGIGPEELRIEDLLRRLKNPKTHFSEVILATNPNIEGEATAMYIARLVKPLGLKVTRIARGLPTGGDLEYADEMTLSKALEGRTEY